MSICFHLYLSTPMTPAQCRRSLVDEAALALSSGPRATELLGAGLSVQVGAPLADPVLRDTVAKMIGFEPSLVVTCTPVLAGARFDEAHHLLGQVFDLLLRRNGGPAAIVLDADRLLAVRRGGGLKVRADARHYVQPSTLEALSQPWEPAVLQP